MSDYTRIRLRRSSASGWLDINPVLALGEAGYESDSKKLKVGDGVRSWSNLDYLRVDPSSIVHPSVSLNIYDGFDQRLSIDLSNNEYLNIIGSGDTNIFYDDNTNSVIIDTQSGDSFLTYENIINRLGFIPQRSGNYSLSNHRHGIPDISGLQLSLDSKQPTGLYSLSGHVHQLSIGDGLNKVINYNTNDQLNLVGSGYTNISFDEYTNTVTIGSIGNSGVLSVNNRTGDINLNFADITSAIGYVPQPVGQYSIVGHKHYAIDIIDLEDRVFNGIIDGGNF
jgi:hypothetical protein